MQCDPPPPPRAFCTVNRLFLTHQREISQTGTSDVLHVLVEWYCELSRSDDTSRYSDLLHYKTEPTGKYAYVCKYVRIISRNEDDV